MSDDLTPEEEAKLEAMRARVAEMDLPEGAEIDFEYLEPDEIARRIADQDSAVFAGGDSYGWYRMGDGQEIIAAVEISGLEWLEWLVAEGRVECELYGICTELEGVPIGTQGYLRLRVMPGDTAIPLYVSFEKAEEMWKKGAMRRFAIIWPPRPDGKRIYMATGVMKQFGGPVQMPGRHNRDERLGRNDPCPCNSGKKFKRCHGT